MAMICTLKHSRKHEIRNKNVASLGFSPRNTCRFIMNLQLVVHRTAYNAQDTRGGKELTAMSSSNAGLSLGSHYQGIPGANDRVEEGCTHQKVPPIMLTLRHQLCRTGRMNTADRADVQRSSMVTLQREKRGICNTFAATELSQKADFHERNCAADSSRFTIYSADGFFFISTLKRILAPLSPERSCNTTTESKRLLHCFLHPRLV